MMEVFIQSVFVFAIVMTAFGMFLFAFYWFFVLVERVASVVSLSEASRRKEEGAK